MPTLTKTRKSSSRATTKKAPRKSTTSKRSGTGKAAGTPAGRPKKKTAASFDKFKTFGDQQYTGVQIGHGHHWHYDQGDWTETKITPRSVGNLLRCNQTQKRACARRIRRGSWNGLPLVHTGTPERRKTKCQRLYHHYDRHKIQTGA
jgi:hypothetical protein